MPAFLVLMFILVPLAEILVILQVGAAIGGWWTVGLLVADSLLGAYLLRVEGRRAWREFRTALQEGRWPGDEVAQGALIIVGGTLLLTPGFLTDAVGFLFLLAPTRRVVSRRLRKRVGEATTSGSPTGARSARDAGAAGASGAAAGGRGRRPGAAGHEGRAHREEEVVLDVEVVEIEREQRAIRPPEAVEDTEVAAEDDADGVHDAGNGDARS